MGIMDLGATLHLGVLKSLRVEGGPTAETLYLK